MDCYQNPGTTWIIVAASERQGCLTARNLPHRSPNECIPEEFLL